MRDDPSINTVHCVATSPRMTSNHTHKNNKWILEAYRFEHEKKNEQMIVNGEKWIKMM